MINAVTSGAHAADRDSAPPLLFAGESGGAASATLRNRPVDGIQDNSFLVEEAYNQEAGVVQHIFNAVYGLNRVRPSDEHSLDFVFTQEWPVFSQTHQFSYTVPYGFAKQGSESQNGLGDILLNYRYQAYLNKESLTAFAPRASLVLPTGDTANGFSSDTLGFQCNLPFSTVLGDSWFLHANAGLTYLPDAAPQPREDLLNYNVGLSAIYALNSDFHIMLEWIGAWNESARQTGGTSRDFESVIAPGVRWARNFKNDSQLVLGLSVPIGLTQSAPDVGVFVYVSFEHYFTRRSD